MLGAFAIIEDDGGTCLNLNLDEEAADFRIEGLNAKRVALAMLRKYPAKVLYVESGRRVRLIAAVKARKSACKVLEMLSKVERITAK